MAKDELRPILEVARGLEYPSESDVPFDAVRWAGGGTLDEAVAKVAGGRPVNETTLGEFFAELEASEEGERWKGLHKTIEQGLGEVRVFRVGERKVDVYIIGRGQRSRAWVGLHTTSVET